MSIETPIPPEPSETPSRTPLPSPRSSRRSLLWPLIGFGIGVGLVLAGALAVWPLLIELQVLRVRQNELLEGGTLVAQQLEELRKAHAELSGNYQSTSADRDNLVVQLKRVFVERDEAETERRRLEAMFREAEGARLGLLEQLSGLEPRLVSLQQSLEEVAKERAGLSDQLAKAKGKSQEKQIRGRLTQMAHKEKALQRSLRQSRKELQAAIRQKDRLSKEAEMLSKRLQSLQGEYTEQVSENATLRRQVDRLPKNVTGLAREHERLLHDLAATHYNMGVLFAEKRDYGRAAKEFQQVIALQPDDAQAHYNLGVIYAEHLPQRDKAIAFFRKYLALQPKGQSANWAKQYIAKWQAWEAKERLE